MDTESERIYDRMSLHRQMREHPSWSPAQLAEAVGRSARWGRKWVKRLRSEAAPSFKMYWSQSRAPKRRPRQTEEPVKDAICTLRERLSEAYHRPAGARLIAQSLQKEMVLRENHAFIPTSSRTINKILRERGYLYDAPKVEHIPLNLCAPMEEWEMDFCEILYCLRASSVKRVVDIVRERKRGILFKNPFCKGEKHSWIPKANKSMTGCGSIG